MKLLKIFSSIRNARSPDIATPPVTAGVAKTNQLQQWAYSPFAFLPRKWEHVRSIDATTFKYYSLNDLLDMLSVVHPEVSLSLWQFLRVANTDIQFKAKNPDGTESKRAQRVLDEMVWKLNHPTDSTSFQCSQGIDKLSLQLLLNAMLRGAMGCELVLDANARMHSIVAFDTGTIYYKTDPKTKRIIPYQWQGLQGQNGYVSLDYPTIFIEAVDEAIDDPYGRNPLASVPAIVAFQLQVLSDLKAALHQVGYPRIHAKLLEEVIRNNAPDFVRMDPAKFTDWVMRIKSDIESQLQNLNPDDILVTTDALEMDLVGKGGTGQMIRTESVIQVIERSLAASLKTLGTILGRPDTSVGGERYAAELKLYSRGIESLQRNVERILERVFTMALNLEGMRGFVDVSFMPVDLRSDLQIVAEKQTLQDVIIAARLRGAISDLEETQLHRANLGLIGLPSDWQQLIEERKRREEQKGGIDIPRHGSPPAT